VGARWGFGERFFELCGTAVTERRVATLAIVEGLDELEQRLTGLLVCLVPLVMHQLALQGAEEALDHGVVVAVAGAAHAGLQGVPGQEGVIFLAGVLNPAVALMQNPFGGLAIHASGAEVQNHGQMQASFLAAAVLNSVGNVRRAMKASSCQHYASLGARPLSLGKVTIGSIGTAILRYFR
jgi:hypothetical protein